MNVYKNHSDADLLILLTEGNSSAFEAIYHRYANNLYRYARKTVFSNEDCEEIIQDIFESLWVRREELGHVQVLNAYLFRMAKYKVIRYIQHSQVRRRYAEHYLLFEAVRECKDEHSNSDPEIHSIIEKGLADLPERCQMAAKLRLIEDLSNEEIASRMNIKKTTVENYMVSAYRHLHQVFPKIYKTIYPDH